MNIILDVGCGRMKSQGAIGIDKICLPGVDLVCDLTFISHPLKNSKVDKIICRHILEHVRNIIPVMEEFHRVLKPGGKLIIIAPHGRTLRFLGDPTHERPITCSTMNYFLPDYPYNFYSKARFKILKIGLVALPRIEGSGVFFNIGRIWWNYIVLFLWKKRVWLMERILCLLCCDFSIEFELEKAS